MAFPELTASACLFFALLLLTVPLPWVGAAILAGGFHEVCHILAIYALGGSMESMTVGGRGAVIRLRGLSRFGELLAAAAGPAGSFLLLFLAERFPRLAACGFFQGIFNLLPVCPLDGGRILFCTLSLIFKEETAEKIQRITECVLLFFLGGLLFLLPVRFFIPGLLLLIFPILRLKKPCKDRCLEVQ